MSSRPRGRAPLLAVVAGASSSDDGTRSSCDETTLAARDVDWSILMARAQAGDGAAYRRLLDEVSPYLRSLAARRHRDPSDVEDAVQDILLTIHAIRTTYDPTRPFGPWLTAIANRRLIDRLRRQGRRRSQETALMAVHETFPDGQANMEEILDRHRLEAAIESLPHQQMQAIRLLKLKELSLKEAAVESKTSVAALKVATHRALRSLRKMLFDWSGT
jgi:RNA polymerase sigma-70 factor (ECF subfamily)